MGYEVLDSRSARGEPDQPDVPAPPAAPPRGLLQNSLARDNPLRDVVPLDPDVDRSGTYAGQAPLRRVAAATVAAAHGPHRASLFAGAALTVGALAGAFIGSSVGGAMALRDAQRAGALADDLADQRTLAVVAYAGDVVRYLGAGGRTALLDVRVANAGPRPVEVAVTPAWAEARPGRPVVRQNSASAVIPPGSDIDVVMTVLTPCDDPSVRIPTVPVRTADGTLHAVPIRSSGGELDLSTDCPQ